MTASAVVDALIGESGARDLELRAQLGAWRDGYRAGAADAEAQFMAGYAPCASDVKAAQHAIYDHLSREAEAGRWRWAVRGEPRTRETFGQPHTDDHTGGPVP